MGNRGFLIAGNWKMNQGVKETEQFLSQLAELLHSSSEVRNSFKQGHLKACLIPPFLSLPQALQSASKLPCPVSIAAQNAHWEKKGAFTGEVSGPMLSELEIRCVLVGHSERRQYFGESDQTVYKRASSLLGQGFQVILCIGETREEREKGKTEEVLTRQLAAAIPSDMKEFLDGRLVIAYEPVWAIGTGLTATPEQAEEAHRFIREWILKGLGKEASEKTLLLYGGSVTPENAQSLLSCSNVDGALVGGASLKPEGFFSLLKTATAIGRKSSS